MNTRGISQASSRTLSGFMAVVCAVVGLTGCSSSTPEDRSITYSADGSSVAFQHGDDGVYLRSQDSSEVEKIYDLAEGEFVASTPNWSPVDKRLVFTAARRAEENAPENPGDGVSDGKVDGNDENDSEVTGDGDAGSPATTRWSESPNGRQFFPGKIHYSCYLREAPQGDEAPVVRKLFEASVDHAGYVASNLAVRWSRDGTSLFYIDQVDPPEDVELAREAERQETPGESEPIWLGLFRFDLATEKSIRVPGLAAHAIAFDISPSGKYISCVSYVVQDDSAPNASFTIQVGDTNQKDWWTFPVQGAYGGLQPLRECLPRWSPSEQHFVFADHRDDASANRIGEVVARLLSSAPRQAIQDSASERPPYVLRVANLVDRSIDTIAESQQRLHDVKWSPNSRHIGFREGDFAGASQLRMIEQRDAPPEYVDHGTLVETAGAFAGWNPSGESIAYVVPNIPGDVQLDDAWKEWSSLLIRDWLSSDRLVIAGHDGKSPQTIFDGMRATFPTWSPEGEELSIWFTFQPSHRTWLGSQFRLDLPAGDPAARINVRTGDIDWLAINGQEKIQIGHYYAIQKEFDKAWKWYSEAAEVLPEPQTPTIEQFAEELRESTNFEIFKYYCLTQLGSLEEADECLRRFEQTFLPAVPEDSQAIRDRLEDAAPGGPNLSEDGPHNAIRTIVASTNGGRVAFQDLHIAQSLLSVGGISAAESFFGHSRTSDKQLSSDEKLSRLIIRAQLLLLDERYDAYARLAVAEILPDMARRCGARALEPTQLNANLHSISDDLLGQHGVMTLLPLYSPEFCEHLSDAATEELLDTAEKASADGDEHVYSLLFRRAVASNRSRADDALAQAELADIEKQLAEAGFDASTVEETLQIAEAFRSLARLSMLRDGS